MLQLIGLGTVIYFAWTWGIISLIATWAAYGLTFFI
jgi:hypothetical protein